MQKQKNAECSIWNRIYLCIYVIEVSNYIIELSFVKLKDNYRRFGVDRHFGLLLESIDYAE